MHQLVCGRNRKNIKMIESMTNTAIYFPPPFSEMYRYCPRDAQRRRPQEIFITGENPENIKKAMVMFHEQLSRMRIFVKEVALPAAKIDSILLTRLDKVRKIIEANGTFILFPPLGSRQTQVSVQAVENLHAERTIRELMVLVRSVVLNRKTGFATLNSYTRLVSSTRQIGGYRSRRRGSLVRTRFAPCSVTFVRTRTPTSRSTS